MGNKYIEQFCPKCNQITIWRVVRRFGGKQGNNKSKPLRRITEKCMACNFKIIKGRKKQQRVRVISFRK